MTVESTSEIYVKIFLSEEQQWISIPQAIIVNVDLIYPAGLQPDKNAMLDHLLRNPGIGETSPFKLLEIKQESLFSKDSKIVHEKLSYTLEPQSVGHFGLTFLQIPFISKDSARSPKTVVSPIIYVETVIPEIAEIHFNSEVAPLATLSQREPIELASTTRSHVMRDYSAYNQQVFQSRIFPWQPILVVFVFLLLTWIIKRFLSRKKVVILSISRQKIAFTEAENILNQLKEQPSLQPSLVETFIIELTDSVRYYFEEEHRLNAPRKTVQEIVQNLQNHPEIAQEKKEAVLTFFDSTERIKFAAYQPSLNECEEVYNQARKILSQDLRTCSKSF